MPPISNYIISALLSKGCGIIGLWGFNKGMKHKKISVPSFIILVLLGLALYFSSGKLDTVLPKVGTESLQVQAVKSQPLPVSKAQPGGKDEVFAYILTQGKLPDYYITKAEARKLGWSSGSLEPFVPGKLIGGDYFGNFEGLLPSQTGREWKEADIDNFGKSSRGAKRIVFSNDGLIYYTADHYSSFTKLGKID